MSATEAAREAASARALARSIDAYMNGEATEVVEHYSALGAIGSEEDPERAIQRVLSAAADRIDALLAQIAAYEKALEALDPREPYGHGIKPVFDDIVTFDAYWLGDHIRAALASARTETT